MKILRINGRLYRVADNPKKRKRKHRIPKHVKHQLKHHAEEAARESISGAIAAIVGGAIILFVVSKPSSSSTG